MKNEVTIDHVKNGGYRSRKLGIKWRFYIFSAVYRNVCFCNYSLSLLTAILDTFFAAVPLVQPLTSFFQHVSDEDSNNILNADNIWYSSDIMGAISPRWLSTNMIMSISIVVIFFSLFFFTIAVINPNYIRKTHIFLMFPVHILLFHFFSAIFGYCIFHISVLFTENTTRSVLALIYLILFIPYFIFFIFMSYIEGNSLIRPNTLYVEWFQGYSLLLPIIIFLMENGSYHTPRLNNLIIRVICYSCEVLICLVMMFYTIKFQPLQYFMMNDLYGARFFISAFYSASAIVINFTDDSLGVSIVAGIPVIGGLFFFFVHHINENRRKSHEKIIDQLDDVENLTVESIKVSLSSLSGENQLKLIIKCGFMAGNKATISTPFVRYCIERYPNNKWILSFIVFLYGTVWGSDPMSYKFFLHMLSVEQYHLIPELLLFQNIYCFMQCSETMSPIISRYLDQYRWSMLIMVQAHKDFWTNATTCISLNRFTLSVENIAYNFLSNFDNLKNLEAMFPFSSSVKYESSMFAADFHHEYQLASKYFNEGICNFKSGIKSVAEALFKGFETAFPSVKNVSELKKIDDPSECNFVSLKEHHDRASRHSNVLATNDNYIKTLSNSFSMKADSLPQHVVFFRAEIFQIIFVTIMMGMSFVVLFFLHLHIRSRLPDEKKVYEKTRELINESLHFRQGLAYCQYDIMLILTIQSRIYENISRQYLRNGGETPELLADDFFWFAIDHLNFAEIATSAYKFHFERMNQTIVLPKLYAFGIESENETFHSLFLDFHRNAVMFIQCRSITAQVFDEVYFYRVIASLADIAEQVYVKLIIEIEEYAKGTLKRNQRWFVSLPVLDFIFGLVFSLILHAFFKSYLRNIFSIVRTIQPPALKVISNQFNRILLFKEHHIPTIKTSPFYRCPILFFNIGLLCISISPIVFCFESIRISADPVFNKTLPALPLIDSSMNFMYYTFAVIEYLIHTNSSTTTFFNQTIVNDIFGENAMNIHGMFDKISDIEPLSYDFYDSFQEVDSVLTTSLSLFFGAIFWLLFIWSSYHYISILMIVRLIFYFIPLRSAQTNPVLSQLYNGQTVSRKKVKLFSNDLQTPPTSFDFFCAIFFNDEGEVISTIGNITKLLKNNNISDIGSLVQFFLKKAQINEGVSLVEFFEKKIAKPIFFSIYEGTELSMQFNNPNELFIKDESANFQTRQKRRITQELSQNAEKIKPKTNLNTNQVVLLIIDHTFDLSSNFLLIAEKSDGILKLDARHNRIIFLISIFSMPNKSVQEAIDVLYNYLNNVADLLPSVKCAVDIGGPLQLIDTSKSPMAKSRAVGPIYDILSIFTSKIEIGKIYITKQVAEVSNLLKIENIEFRSFKVTDATKIEAASITTDIIKAITNKK